jgi:hypothetical protein
MNMKKKILLSAMMSVVTFMVMADEYIDPQTNVVYTYEPGQTTASVKAGDGKKVEMCPSCELDMIYRPGSPDAAGDVVILDRFTVGAAEYVVTSIGDGAFMDNRNINSVSIPETVTSIGTSAFTYCDNLTTVQLPAGLTEIAKSVFYGCSNLVNLTLPTSITFIGKYAFKDTPWFTKQYDEAPNGPLYIGSLLFGYKGDKPAGDLVIKEGTTCIGYYAFNNCDGLTSVTIPGSIAYIDEGAFANCTGLTAVRITDLAAWCGIDIREGSFSNTSPLNYAHHLYLDGKEVTDLVIPEGVTRIGSYTFNYCTALPSVTIPNGVTTIGLYAFRGCDGLTSVTIPSSIATIESGAFLLCSNLNAMYISDLAAWCRIPFNFAANPLTFDAHLYLNGEEVTDLVIPEGVTSISYGAFQGCTHLTSATIPNGVTSIDDYAFDKCSGLISVSFPPSLDKIGYSAFAYCSSLFSVTIPEGITSIEGLAFKECNSLYSITIPASVSSIGRDAFRNCWNLSSVISLIEEPFGIPNGVFGLYNSETYESSFTSATLYVPKGCKSRYEAAAGWKLFTNIVEMNGADIDAVRIADSKNSDTNTYDLMGRHLNSQLQKGLYIHNGKKILK